MVDRYRPDNVTSLPAKPLTGAERQRRFKRKKLEEKEAAALAVSPSPPSLPALPAPAVTTTGAVTAQHGNNVLSAVTLVTAISLASVEAFFGIAGMTAIFPASPVPVTAMTVVRPPFSPDAVVEELAALMKTYGIKRVTGDKYAGEFPRELFRKQGITYDLSERTKSQIYIEALPLLNSGRVELLDNQRLISQLCGLERRTARGGKDSIDHPQGSKDDVPNQRIKRRRKLRNKWQERSSRHRHL